MKANTKKGIVSEFRDFAMRGNVIDLAVGVIIGGAFQKIISSLVDDVIMPLIGWIFGNVDFSNLFYILGIVPGDADQAKLSSLAYVKDELGLAVFAYGSFITSIINFLLMALVIFFFVKLINKVKSLSEKDVEEEEQAPEFKSCDYCKSQISIEAIKCPQCTSDLNDSKN